MSTAKRKIILKKLSALNTVWHPESGLVFKSQKERLVIGSYIDNNLVDLDEDSLALCDEWNFKPDESLLATEDDAEDDAEDNEEEDAEEDTENNSEKEQENSDGDEEPVSEENVSEDDVPKEETNKSDPDTNQKDTQEQTVCTNENVDIQQHLDTFQKDIDNLSKNLSISLTPIFVALQTKINQLENELRQKTIDNEELQSKYDAMDQKFKTMKSLFS
jgi:hypothetical protein